MPRFWLFILPLALTPAISYASSPTRFSQQEAESHLRFLSVEIGARTMGSPAERRALHFAAAKFAEYGCQEAYVMPVTIARGVNTNSGVAVGILKGRTNRTILLGAHIDTSSPEVPGANDNASGVACVLELARVLGRNQHTSTIVFCCWGGEEEGLCGSDYFVDHFPLIDSIALMLQIDMADGSGRLEIDPDAAQRSAPRWLVQAVYDVFYDSLGYSGLMYPTNFAVLNSLAGESAGSDHVPFLQHGIPAVCLSSDINYPIHVPQDNLGNFTPSGLQRSGDLVLNLVRRFDGRVPERSTERYFLLQCGNQPVFLPHWALWTLVFIAVLLAFLALARTRRRRLPDQGPGRVRWSVLKVLLFSFIIQICLWYSETIVGFLKAERYPWINNFWLFTALAVSCALLGVWISLRLASSFKITRDAFVYTRAAYGALLMLLVLTLFSGPVLASYVALSILFLSLALFVTQSWAKLLFVLVTPVPVLRLIFTESLVVFQRPFTRVVVENAQRDLVVDIVLVLLGTVVSFPLVLAFAAVYRDSGRDLLCLSRFKSTRGLVVVAAVSLSLVIILATGQSYDRLWQTVARVDQKFTLGSDSSTIEIRGSDNLGGLSVHGEGRDTVIHGNRLYHRVRPLGPSIVSWLRVDRLTVEGLSVGATDSLATVERRVLLHSRLHPYQVSITYSSTMPFDVTSTASHGGSSRRRESDRRKIFRWYSFPPEVLSVPITLHLRNSQRVTEEIEVVYDSLAYPLIVQRPFTDFIKRTTVVARDSFGVSPSLSGVARKEGV